MPFDELVASNLLLNPFIPGLGLLRSIQRSIKSPILFTSNSTPLTSAFTLVQQTKDAKWFTNTWEIKHQLFLVPRVSKTYWGSSPTLKMIDTLQVLPSENDWQAETRNIITNIALHCKSDCHTWGARLQSLGQAKYYRVLFQKISV